MSTTPHVQLSLHINMTDDILKEVETYNIQYDLKLVLVYLNSFSYPNHLIQDATYFLCSIYLNMHYGIIAHSLL